jgi:hypothetical protein
VAQQLHRWAHLNLNILASRAGLCLHLLPSKLGSQLMGKLRTKFSLPPHHFVQFSLHLMLLILQFSKSRTETSQLIKSIMEQGRQSANLKSDALGAEKSEEAELDSFSEHCCKNKKSDSFSEHCCKKKDQTQMKHRRDK